MRTAREFKVSWPRSDRKEMRYSIKRDYDAAKDLYDKLIRLGHTDVEFHERKVRYENWVEIKEVR